MSRQQRFPFAPSWPERRAEVVVLLVALKEPSVSERLGAPPSTVHGPATSRAVSLLPHWPCSGHGAVHVPASLGHWESAIWLWGEMLYDWG